jgi:hypothetical protein
MGDIAAGGEDREESDQGCGPERRRHAGYHAGAFGGRETRMVSGAGGRWRLLRGRRCRFVAVMPIVYLFTYFVANP